MPPGDSKSTHLLIALSVIALFGVGRNGAWNITAALTAAWLFAAVHLGTMATWLSGFVMQGLGKISYSLYLFHPIVGWSAQSLALKYTNQWVALIVGVAASLLSAWIAYLVLERPAIRLSRLVSLGPWVKRLSKTG